MLDGHSEASWAHTASIMALIANVNRDPKRRSTPFTANDFNPYAKRVEPQRIKVKFSALKSIFVDQTPEDFRLSDHIRRN